MPTPHFNQLLALLEPSDLALLQPCLERFPLEVGTDLEVPGGKVSHVYFPEDGIVSIVASMPPGHDIEVGIVGRDGMVGAAVVLGDKLAAHRAFVQIEGTALRVAAPVLLNAVENSGTLRGSILRYIRIFGIQVAGTALANGHSNIEERLARWIVMCTDRLDSDTLILTHEFLSLMLGVRRAGVTLALQSLEGKGAIRALRGRIILRDRKALLALAGGGYGLPEAEYERLIGKPDFTFRGPKLPVAA